MADRSIRLDQFLCFARFVRTRGLAQAIVGAGHVRLDGRPVSKASAAVRVGSIVGLPLGDRVRIVRVAAIPERRGPAPEARACYVDLVPGASPAPAPASAPAHGSALVAPPVDRSPPCH